MHVRAQPGRAGEQVEVRSPSPAAAASRFASQPRSATKSKSALSNPPGNGLGTSGEQGWRVAVRGWGQGAAAARCQPPLAAKQKTQTCKKNP